jgi:RNA polymerase sigma factor (sigma-70 family)
VTMTAPVPPSPLPEEQLLVAAVRRGDEVAFAELVRRHMRHAFGLAYRILGQREDAEDVVQEAFMAALGAIDTFDEARSFAPWFSRIVVNRALNARKRATARVTVVAGDGIAADTASPALAAEQGDVRERVGRAIERLPERQRTIVRLSAYDGLSSGEIGELLDMPAGTVRWELHQARAALRTDLAACREAGS